jgi:hypothetical protein
MTTINLRSSENPGVYVEPEMQPQKRRKQSSIVGQSSMANTVAESEARIIGRQRRQKGRSFGKPLPATNLLGPKPFLLQVAIFN